MTDRILIVDDSLTVRMDLSDAFEAAGFQPILCATAAEARGALARLSLSAVILDVLLPDGDGVELLGEIRESPVGATLPVLMLSTEAEISHRIRGLKRGADEYVGKPYDAGYVVAKTRELMRLRSASPGSATPILVIDDSLTFREELRSALEVAGYLVITAASGEEGLQLAAARPPAAIIVDGELPGMDGPAVIRSVRLDAALLRRVPCLLLTGSEGKGAELRALDAGADAFVRKEEDVPLILAKLAAVLRSVSARMAVEETPSLLSPKKILAVDDSATYLQALAESLRGDGYEVIQARSGEEALALLAVQSVDCVLLDLMMPGMGGEATCRRIKTAPVVRDTPLIMLTAMEDRDAMIRGLGAGADDYISKSSEFEILKARVRTQIRRKQFEDEHRHIREELLHKEVEAAESRAASALAETRAVLIGELEKKNAELEAFSYSVSHDLRAPLRGIDGFSLAVLQDYGDMIGPEGQDYLHRVRSAAQRMGELIDDLLNLSRVGRAELRRTRIDMSELVRDILVELGAKDPGRDVQVDIRPNVFADADQRLVRVALDNLVGNAWKFTAGTIRPEIAFGAEQRESEVVYFVRDTGAGFNMNYADKLFRPFQRLHKDTDFEGTGIGLATVHRIMDRHGGRVWAEGAVGKGATFFFTIPSAGRAGSLAL